jgi:hypothetical protein
VVTSELLTDVGKCRFKTRIFFFEASLKRSFANGQPPQDQGRTERKKSEVEPFDR